MNTIEYYSSNTLGNLLAQDSVTVKQMNLCKHVNATFFCMVVQPVA